MSDIESLLDNLYDAVLDGDGDQVAALVEQLIAAGAEPDVILNDTMITAMDVVGQEFEDGDRFVPEMLVSANAMQEGLNVLKPLLAASDVQPIGKIAIGTVQGDIHDVGKNLVIMMLEGAGFEVVDLGVNVTPDKFVQAVRDGAQIVGMSALLTTTMANIPVVVEQMVKDGVRDGVKLIIGGAPLTPEYAEKVGVDGYAPDASQAVKVAKQLISTVLGA